MKRATAVIPAVFCIEGVLLILRSAQVLALFSQWSLTNALLHLFWQAFVPSLRSALPVMGISSLIVAWGLTQKKRWAWRGGMILGGLHLTVFPFLVPVGIALMALLKKGKDDLLLVDPLLRVQWENSSDKKEVPWAYSAVVAAVVTAIGIGAYTLVQYSQTANYPKLPLWALPLAILLSAAITAIVHELGHAAGSYLAGFQMASLSVGPFWLSRNLAGWQWKFVPNLGWTGAIASARPLTHYNLHTNVFLYLASGPLATLFLGSISLTLFLAAKFGQWGAFADGFGILAMVALIDFLSEMSLVRKGHVYTDGARLMQLWTGGLERRRLLATYAMGLCETTARRPSEWLAEWLDEPTSDPNSPLYFAGCYYAYVYELDKENYGKAGHWLDELLGSNVENPSPARRWKAAVEGAFYEAMYRDDAVRARQWLSAPRDGLAVEPVSEWRAEAAVHMAEGDLAGCADRILKIRARLAEAPGTGWKSFELALVEQLDQKLNGSHNEGLRSLCARLRDEMVEEFRMGSQIVHRPAVEVCSVGAGGAELKLRAS